MREKEFSWGQTGGLRCQFLSIFSTISFSDILFCFSISSTASTLFALPDSGQWKFTVVIALVLTLLPNWHANHKWKQGQNLEFELFPGIIQCCFFKPMATFRWTVICAFINHCILYIFKDSAYDTIDLDT